MHCDLAEIDRRERDRGDRRIGEGRSHVETDLIHTFGPYDFEVDTTNTVPRAVAASVLAAWQARTRRRALRQGISGIRGTLSVPVATALVAAYEYALTKLAVGYSGAYLALFGNYRFLITRSGRALSGAGLVVRLCWIGPRPSRRQLSIM